MTWDVVIQGFCASRRSFFNRYSQHIFVGEFDKLHSNLKEIDNGGNVVMNKIGSKSCEESQVVGDPNAVRANRCRKRLKSLKEKAISEGSRQCCSCGGHGHDKLTCIHL